MATLELHCPTCGERRRMKSVRKATGSGVGCISLLIAGFFALAGLALPLLWIVAVPLGIVGLYYGSKAARVWRCTVCNVEIRRG